LEICDWLSDFPPDCGGLTAFTMTNDQFSTTIFQSSVPLEPRPGAEKPPKTVIFTQAKKFQNLLLTLGRS
jgi:hypothetical protein